VSGSLMSRHSSELGSTTRRYPRLSLRGLMISTSPVAAVTAAASGGAAPLAGSPGASVSRGLESKRSGAVSWFGLALLPLLDLEGKGGGRRRQAARVSQISDRLAGRFTAHGFKTRQ
jgi:hypothetical protein